MGKYNVIKSAPDNDKEWLLEKIANELAELNRLKRIEISMNITIITPKITGAQVLHLKSELEDQA